MNMIDKLYKHLDVMMPWVLGILAIAAIASLIVGVALG